MLTLDKIKYMADIKCTILMQKCKNMNSKTNNMHYTLNKINALKISTTGSIEHEEQAQSSAYT